MSKHATFVALAAAGCLFACNSMTCGSAAANTDADESSLAAQLSAPRPGEEPIRRYVSEVAQQAPEPAKPELVKEPAPSRDPRREVLANRSSALGTNLSEFQDWSAEFSLIDAMKQSRDWISSSDTAWDSGWPLDLDEQGWPKSLRPHQMARTLLFWGSQVYPAGEYVILYDGDGELRYEGNTEIVTKSKGREVLRVDPKKGGIGILIVRTNPANPLRNMRVLMPGGTCVGDATQWCDADGDCGANKRCQPFEENYKELVFHPQFLSTLKPYSVVRFMNWMRTNNSTQKLWKDRPKPSDVRFTVRGVPVEVMVALANRMQMDPWFCMPHMADDEYVESFGRYVAQHLAPGLKAYVEHSNEVWNGAFPGQHWYAAEQGAKLEGKDQSRFGRQMLWHSLRSKQIFALWKKAFGGQTSRFVRVLAGWAANPYTNEQILTNFDAYKEADALAVAPYLEATAAKPGDTVDQGFDGLKKMLADIRDTTKKNAEITKKHNLRLIAYEGGQGFVAWGEAAEDPRINALFDDMNRDPRIKQVYLRYFDDWREAGGELFVHYKNVESYSRYGRWGTRENMLQPVEKAPKLQAILEWSKAHPRWWR